MRRLRNILLLVCLSVWLSASGPVAADSARQQPGPPEPTPTPPRPPTSQAILKQMTVADKVGQLFIVTFTGNDVSEDSDIGMLVRDYRIGGVVLSPSNDNFRNAPAPAPTTGAEPPQDTAQDGLLTTPEQIALLTASLQTLAVHASQSITTGVPLTDTTASEPTDALTTTVATTSTLPLLPQAAGSTDEQSAKLGGGIPLLIGLNWSGDDSSFFFGMSGFTPLPSEMAIGATWSPFLAERVGQVVGQELAAVGVNLLLGPTLDVLDVPRPGSKGDLDTRTFGGDPFWVGQMGEAFIRGVQIGGRGAVLTAAKHFPGQGGSDRRPDDEVATIQKSVQQLRQIELAPFASVTAGSDLRAPGVTPAMMTSHIRYRGFQGNIRQLTPPISLAPQLQDLMSLREFAEWRTAGGVLISDALGVPALRRYYDPALQKFPHRQVAQDAFLAGNDMLFLSRFALTDEWPDQLKAITETISFFQDKYLTDNEFRIRMDAAVERIIRLKLSAYGGSWHAADLQHEISDLADRVGQNGAVTQAIARAALTLIYPGREEFADRMPTAPLTDENILIITDAREVRECATCDPVPLIPPTAIEEIILRLYGPDATGQIAPKNVRSLTFSDLNRLLSGQSDQEQAIEEAIDEAKWIIFAQLDYDPDGYPDSVALRSFLARRSDSLRDKRLVVLAFSAPYYLDTTEISKLTAYFGVYSKTGPFLETAVRALFREFTPTGAPPVTITGINYELIRQLEPAPGQIIPLGPVGAADTITGSIKVGSQVVLETGVIQDRKGHPVPDGTPVEFHLLYPTESLALAPKIETTSGGKARTIVPLDRPGELWITVQASEAKNSTRIELKVGGDTPGSIATVVPTPSPAPTAAPPQTPQFTAIPPTTAGDRLGDSSRRSAANAGQPRVAFPAFLFGLMGTALSGGAAFAVRRRRSQMNDGTNQDDHKPFVEALVAALWAGTAAWIAYLLYAFGWLPGSTALQLRGYSWAAGAVTLIGGAISLLWTGRERTI